MGEEMKLNYTAKRTRHRRLEAYDLIFEDNLKAQVEKVSDGKWRMIITISGNSSLVVMRDFKTMDEVAEYAFEKKKEEREWVKKNVIAL